MRYQENWQINKLYQFSVIDNTLIIVFINYIIAYEKIC